MPNMDKRVEPQVTLDQEIDATKLSACHCCGMVHALPELAERQVARCLRCSSVLHLPDHSGRANSRARAFALAALFLFPVAVTLPIMRIERFGDLQDASIWSGALGLIEEGAWFVGIVVILCSLFIPLMKLGGILILTSKRPFFSRRRRAWTYRMIELAGRWGMLDVLLISVVVAWLKMGDLVSVHPGPAAWTFTGCVLLSLLASASFDPHALWLRSPRTTPS